MVKNGATNDQVIDTAELNKPFAVEGMRSYAVDSHDLVQHIVVLPDLRPLPLSYLHDIDSRELNVKIVLFGIRSLFGVDIALLVCNA